MSEVQKLEELDQRVMKAVSNQPVSETEFLQLRVFNLENILSQTLALLKQHFTETPLENEVHSLLIQRLKDLQK